MRRLRGEVIEANGELQNTPEKINTIRTARRG